MDRKTEVYYPFKHWKGVIATHVLISLVEKIRLSIGLRFIIRTQFWFRNMIDLKTCQMCLLMITAILRANITSHSRFHSVVLQNTWNILFELYLYLLVRAYVHITKGKRRVSLCSGFFKLVSKLVFDQITIGYLPTLPFSPTENKVIVAEIRKTQGIKKESETNFIFIEADQALDKKVLDVMLALKNKGIDLFAAITPCMGGFHIGMCVPHHAIHDIFKDMV